MSHEKYIQATSFSYKLNVLICGLVLLILSTENESVTAITIQMGIVEARLSKTIDKILFQ